MKGKEISGYDGKYTIFPNGTVRRNPSKYRRKTMFLKPKPGRYYRVALYNESGRKEVSIHRLVAQYFIPNPKNLPWVNHKDGNKHNNDVSNLEWCSPSENEIHSIKVLKRNRNTPVQRESAVLVGKSKRKLSMQQAERIRGLVKAVPRKALAQHYDVSLSVIDCIVQGRRYVD